jgi:hypothetical protein
MALKDQVFGDPSSSTQFDARNLQQLAKFGQGFISPHSIDFVIGIFRHFVHGNHQPMREAVLLGFHLYYTPLKICSHGQGFLDFSACFLKLAGILTECS